MSKQKKAQEGSYLLSIAISPAPLTGDPALICSSKLFPSPLPISKDFFVSLQELFSNRSSESAPPEVPSPTVEQPTVGPA